MSEESTVAQEGGGVNDGGLPGVIKELGELGPGAIITEPALAKMLGKHPVSVKRAVDRGELPRPVRFMGSQAWTVGAIVTHFEARLDAAAKEAARLARTIAEHRP